MRTFATLDGDYLQAMASDGEEEEIAEEAAKVVAGRSSSSQLCDLEIQKIVRAAAEEEKSPQGEVSVRLPE